MNSPALLRNIKFHRQTMHFLRKIIWPIWAAGFTLSGLIAMHLIERLANLPPCLLCYQQRQIYWAIATIGIIATISRRINKSPLSKAILNGALSILFVGSFIAAFYHSGVEWKWWLGPAGCSVGADIPDILNLELDFSKTDNFVSCSDAPWRFANLSFAGWNAFASLAFAFASLNATLSQIRNVKGLP